MAEPKKLRATWAAFLLGLRLWHFSNMRRDREGNLTPISVDELTGDPASDVTDSRLLAILGHGIAFLETHDGKPYVRLLPYYARMSCAEFSHCFHITDRT